MTLTKNSRNTWRVFLTSKNFETLKNLVIYFLSQLGMFTSSILTALMKDITVVCNGDYGCGGNGCSGCSGFERFQSWVFSHNTVKCCPHDHWRSIIIISSAKDTAIVRDGFITECHVFGITKVNVVINCTTRIKQLPLNTATAAVPAISSKKSINVNWTRFD